MATKVPRELLEIRYYHAAQEYLRNLPLEHFMEALPQGTQREITLESFALVKVHRKDVHVYNEILLQYAQRRRKQPGQVVPDNTIIVWPEPLEVDGSYDVPLQPVGPFWVLEYVSKHSKRKGYEENLEKYEHDLKVPYYLTFYPDNQELTLRRHNGQKYVTVIPNDNGRYAVPELEMELALLDGWVRYWFRGELLPLPGDLLLALEQTKQQLAAADRRARESDRRAEESDRRARDADRQAREANQQAEQERQARSAAEEELARMKAEIEQLRRRPKNNH